MDLLSWEKQQHFRMRAIAPVDGVILFKEAIIADDFLPRELVLERRIETHRSAAVCGQLGDSDAKPCRFVLAERKGLVVECPADVAGLQRALAQDAGRQVGEAGRAAGAVPEIILIASPEVARQHTALVAADLGKIAQVIPLPQEQARLEGTGVLDEDLVE